MKESPQEAAGAHESTEEIMQYFSYEHLPERLQPFSKPICDAARWMDETLPDCEEKRVGLRKLLEAKDCAVRAAVRSATR